MSKRSFLVLPIILMSFFSTANIDELIKTKLVFIGEIHREYGNVNQAEIINEINKKRSIHNLVLEISQGFGYVFNDLAKNSEDTLIFEKYLSLQGYSKNTSDCFRKIYSFCLKNPKIKITGIDRQFDFKASIEEIKYLLNKNNINLNKLHQSMTRIIKMFENSTWENVRYEDQLFFQNTMYQLPKDSLELLIPYNLKSGDALILRQIFEGIKIQMDLSFNLKNFEQIREKYMSDIIIRLNTDTSCFSIVVAGSSHCSKSKLEALYTEEDIEYPSLFMTIQKYLSSYSCISVELIYTRCNQFIKTNLYFKEERQDYKKLNKELKLKNILVNKFISVNADAYPFISSKFDYVFIVGKSRNQ